MSMIVTKIFIVWLLVLPFVSWYGIYEGAKIAYFWSGGFFLVLFWLLKQRQGLVKVIKTSDYLYLGWVGVLLVASFLGVHPLDSIIGGSYRHQGVLFFITLWLVGKTITLLSQKGKKILREGIRMTVLIEAIIIIYQKMIGEPLLFGRPLGTFGEANAAAGFLAIGSVFVAPFFYQAIILLAILVSGSRTALAVFVFVILGRFILGRRKTSFGSLTLFSLVRPYSEFENRPLFWRLGIQEVLKRPVLGYGAESGEAVFDKAFSKTLTPLVGLMVDRSHNLFLDVAIWSGVLGLSLFVAWLVIEIKTFWERKNWLTLIAIFAWLGFSMFQPLGVVHWVLLVVLLNISTVPRY